MVKCPTCGTEVPDGARFCQNCGAEVAGRPGTEPGIAIAPEPAPYLPQPQAPYAAPIPTAPVPTYAYPPPPYPVVPGQPYQPARSGKAIAGMWLGIVSIPGMILSWVGIVIGVLGLIFSLIGLNEIRRRERSGYVPAPSADRRQAVAGIICSIIGIAGSSAFLIYILSHLDDFGIKLTR
ncbi:MAG: zinc-ribbon domain-containing protein [Thermomicrobiales bacterium]